VVVVVVVVVVVRNPVVRIPLRVLGERHPAALGTPTCRPVRMTAGLRPSLVLSGPAARSQVHSKALGLLVRVLFGCSLLWSSALVGTVGAPGQA